ncbi:MAG: hypothetical protein WHV63_07165 [Ignavibacteria bacterium]|nr:hypothetical protein [Ignavibacteria bacterium]
MSLNEIFEAIKNNSLTQSQLNQLTNKIKQIILTNISLPDLEDLSDLISNVILSINIHLKNDNPIDNPEAFLKTIVLNSIKHRDINDKETQKLITNLKNILRELENDGIIHSYNNGKFYYVDGFDINSNRWNRDDVLNRFYAYDFTEINKEEKWSEKKKQLIKEVILDFLNIVGSIEFTVLIDLLKIKLCLNVIYIDKENPDQDENDDEDHILEEENDMINTPEQVNIINSICEKYREKLFELTNSKSGRVILKSIYYRYFEEKTFQDIASLLSYTSPTTIQIQINNNYQYTPEGFLKTISLLDQNLINHFDFLNQLLNKILWTLKDVFDEISENDSE